LLNDSVSVRPAEKSAGRSSSEAPLANGTQRERALEAVVRLAAAVDAGWEDADPHPALAAAGGRALFLYHAAAAGLAEPRRAAERARAVMGALREHRLDDSLHFGIAGVAWLRAHLEPAGAARATRALDERLARHLDARPWSGRDDLLYGLAGIAVRFLERPTDPLAAECLERVATRLSELAEPASRGRITWRCRTVDPALPASAPARYDLGVAHGVPGQIAALAGIHAAEIATERAGELLEGAVPWVLDQVEPEGDGGRLPHFAGDERSGRTAWCRGDLGAALALLAAARALDREDWRRAAVALLRAAAERPAERTRVADAAVCHGAAGLALCFARGWEATGDPVLARAAERWGLRAAALEPAPPDGDGLLRGTAGVGLALLTVAGVTSAPWDRVLATSVAGVPPEPAPP